MKYALPFALALMMSAPAWAADKAPAGNATAGSGGAAAVNGQTATTAGVGAVSNTPDTSSKAMAMGGAAAGDNAKSRSAVHGNNNLNGNAMAMAHDGGDMARSHTICHDRDDSVACRTKTMAHEPGSKPVKSTSEGSAAIQ
jgi:hypothetical protein